MNRKQPIHKGIAKTPMVMQLETMECGAACLAMILGYYEKYISLEQVRADSDVSRDGTNANNILKAGNLYHLRGTLTHPTVVELEKEGTFPCIIQWKYNAYVVLKGFKGKYALINDPAVGEIRVPLDRFVRSYTGTILSFVPDESFAPTGKRKTTWNYIKGHVNGLGVAIVFVLLATAITSLISIIQPGMSRVFYDRLLTGKDPEWLRPVLLGMLILTIIQFVGNAVQSKYFSKISGKIDVVGNSTYMWKVFRLPMEFFGQRMAGEILNRKNSNQNVANTIVNILAPIVLNAMMLIFYFWVMCRYSIILSLIAFAATVVNYFSARMIAKMRVNAMRVNMRDAGKLYGTTLSGIEMIETIKASGSENGYFEKWSGYQASAYKGENDYGKTTITVGLIPGIASAVANTAIISIGIYLTMKGEFTLGMLNAFQGYFACFNSPATRLAEASQALQEMKTEIERIDDVMNYPIDPIFESEEKDAEDYTKLSGLIEMKNVTFGYSKFSEPVIKDFNLTIHPGERIAFVGASGCGKSTLSKLISGLVKPWSGEILFDGKPISEIDRAVFTGSLAVVDQDTVVFEDTIKNNIKMWDQTIEDFEVVLAARDAQIHEDILSRDRGYDYVISEGGRNFSGGQLQRFEIARVLAQDPTICILDEATSALDAKTEYNVTRSISARGITCLIVAHRLSTIRDCDKILVLDNGAVVEQGTHEELMQLKGRYLELITNE